MPIGSTVVEAVGLRKRYGARLALDDVSLSVRTGEVVGLLGPNGAGKTTTLSILATLLDPDAGEIRPGPGARRSKAAQRRRLGFVPQSLALYPSLGALQNLELFARIHGIPRRKARADSMSALELVGLTERAHDPVAVLSGGMKRRLNLACGIVHHPELLLLDEPTVGVDPQSRKRILESVRAAAARGAGIIYSTHYMEEVEQICDRVLLIDRGRLAAHGTVKDLIALAGGQPRMEILFGRPPAPLWYASVAGVSAIAKRSDPDDPALTFALQLESLAMVGALLECARGTGAQVLEFSVHTPNLSDAFMTLTGHTLRENSELS